MTTAVQTGIGSEFWLKPATGILVKIGEVTNVPIPNGTTDLIDASHMGTVGFRDYIQSPLQDGEEADLEINWIPNSATDLLLRDAVGFSRDFKVVCPVAGGHYDFTGACLVRRYVRTNPMDDKRTATLTVKWMGTITEAFVAVP